MVRIKSPAVSGPCRRWTHKARCSACSRRSNEGSDAAGAAQPTTGDAVWQGEGVAAQHIYVLVTVRRQTRDILFEHLETFVAQLVQTGVRMEPLFDECTIP